MKCQLKALKQSDYPVRFTGAQWNALRTAFPTGVCDFFKPGVGFQPSIPWLTYDQTPGGRPLGATPSSPARLVASPPAMAAIS